MSQQKEQQRPIATETKLQQFKDKLPDGKIKDLVNDKIKNLDKPIQK